MFKDIYLSRLLMGGGGKLNPNRTKTKNIEIVIV